MKKDPGAYRFGFDNLETYLPLGCLILDVRDEPHNFSHFGSDWTELFDITPSVVHSLFTEVSGRVVKAVQRLLKAGWIRAYIEFVQKTAILRIYILPDDIGRATIARGSRALRSELEQLLPSIEVAPSLWNGSISRDSAGNLFDAWAQSDEGSLFYIFNTLPSPGPNPIDIRDRYTRLAVSELLDYDRIVPGLQTPLYPYQARSAAAMIQREASTHLQIDPRFEERNAPDGSLFYFSPKDLAFYRTPPMYESQRGGILAETMGLGKTIICLAVILATRHHLPKIPPQYRKNSIRDSVPRLVDLCIRSAGEHSIPIKSHFCRVERSMGTELVNCIKRAETGEIDYFIPGKAPRSNRKTVTPPSKRMVLCSGTIVVVPRNIVHQWKSELKKHADTGQNGLKVLIMDNPSTMLPPARELRHYDVVLFSKPRFEKEIMDGNDKFGRNPGNVRTSCNCIFYRSGMDEECICLREEDIYHSPLKQLHWLRIIIDEGHEFSSANSNAVLVADRLVKAERRWVVSGTPAKERLYGIEADFAQNVNDDRCPPEFDDTDYIHPSDPSTPQTESSWSSSGQAFKLAALNRRKAFNVQEDVGSTSATRGLSLLIQHFLKIRPWFQEEDDSKIAWEDHVYRHMHFRNKTYSGFSICLRKTLENIVVKTQPEDVERDIQLPPLTHTTVRLDPSFYDKLTSNMFVFVLSANAITSERTDVDYLFHKNSAKARHSLIANLRQSHFFWTGFSTEDVRSAIKTSSEYLKKDNANCSPEDRQLLTKCIEFAQLVLDSPGWAALSRHHEVGMFVDHFPDDSVKAWALKKDSVPLMIGAAQVLQAQALVNMQLLSDDPLEGLQTAGEVASVAMEAKAEEEAGERTKKASNAVTKTGIPNSAVHQELTAKKGTHTSSPSKAGKPAMKSPLETKGGTLTEPTQSPTKSAESPANIRKRKRELEAFELAPTSELRKPCIIGTTSAKLTYLLDRISELQYEEKIIVFYDGDNTAYYVSQCLDILHIKHLIYAKTLPNDQRSRYIVTFDIDDSIRVLLMDIRCGAFGLNVNKASRVFFINPVCRPGTEVQAFKRAHRIGQTKPVYVETLVLNGTIEAGILERSRKMTQTEHYEASQLSDDKGIAEIIQNAKAIPVALEEGMDSRQMARLNRPIQIFGRPGRGDTKIKGIDKELDFVTAAGPEPTKKKKGTKLSKDTPNHASYGINTVISGVEWMITPVIDRSLKPHSLTPETSKSISTDTGASKESIFG